MKIIFALVLVLFGYSAVAQELAVVGHGFSYHTEDKQQYNQNNWGAAIRLDYATFALQAGSYRNSYSRQSEYAVLDLNLLRYDIVEQVKLELGPMLAIANGYLGYSFLAAPGVQVAVRNNDFYLRARAMPALTTTAVFAVEIGYVFYRF